MVNPMFHHQAVAGWIHRSVPVNQSRSIHIPHWVLRGDFEQSHSNHCSAIDHAKSEWMNLIFSMRYPDEFRASILFMRWFRSNTSPSRNLSERINRFTLRQISSNILKPHCICQCLLQWILSNEDYYEWPMPVYIDASVYNLWFVV